MALQMATNITPDSLSGVGGAVFDASAGLNVKWQVNGVSPMVAYQIVIMANDTESTELYDTGKVTLAQPFYGIRYNGQVVFFEADTISAAALSTATITNGNTYKMVITQWWGATDAESVTQNSASLIEAWTPPTLTLGAVPSPLTTRTNSFTATYSQAEGDTIAWVRWRIALKGEESSPLLDTGNIYGTSQLQADYDAFFTGETYSVRCDVETNAGQQATTGWQTVTVSYPTIKPNGLLNVECRPDGGIGVNWSTARTNIGTADGDYSITNGELNLSNGASVSWTIENGEPIAYAAPWTVLWRGIPWLRGGGNLFEIATTSGTVTASIASPSSGTATVTANLNGTPIGTINISSPSVYLDRVWTLVINEDTLFVGYAEGAGGLYPENALYPLSTLYPRDNTSYVVSTWTQALSFTQGTIGSVELLGAQETDWLWIVSGSMESTDIGAILNDAGYEPAWGDEATVFLAGFEDGLNAGNLNTTGYALYRRNLTTGEYGLVGEFGINELSVVDYAVSNRHGYVYQLWYTDATTYTTTPIESADITPCTWNYSILGCSKDENGVYHVQRLYPFSANVTTNAVSNNNEPKVQRNFTAYPAWQPDTALYQSGKLKALIGRVNENNQYVGDTVEYAKELRSLSLTDMTLFLKDRRGSLLMIRPNGPIQMETKDEWYNQAVSIELPWIEVGDASNVSIILAATDGEWVDDEILESVLTIDPATGNLVWTVPKGYSAGNSGSGLALTSAGYLVQEIGPWYKPATMRINQTTQILTAEV